MSMGLLLKMIGWYVSHIQQQSVNGNWTIFEGIVHCDSDERNGDTVNTMQHEIASVHQRL